MFLSSIPPATGAVGPPAADTTGENAVHADAELAAACQAREEGEYRAAYDALLAAMRVVPRVNVRRRVGMFG